MKVAEDWFALWGKALSSRHLRDSLHAQARRGAFKTAPTRQRGIIFHWLHNVQLKNSIGLPGQIIALFFAEFCPAASKRPLLHNCRAQLVGAKALSMPARKD